MLGAGLLDFAFVGVHALVVDHVVALLAATLEAPGNVGGNPLCVATKRKLYNA